MTAVTMHESQTHFECEQVYAKYVKMFRETGCKHLTVIGSLLGSCRKKVQDISIRCNGDSIQGRITIDKLMDDGALADGGMVSNKFNEQVYYLGKAATFFPFSAIMFLETMKTVGEKELAHTLFTRNTLGVFTSLPLSLRYSYAAALPLGLKTRQVHLFWMIRNEHVYHKDFDRHFYRCRVISSSRYPQIHLYSLSLAYETKFGQFQEPLKIAKIMGNLLAIQNIRKSSAS